MFYWLADKNYHPIRACGNCVHHSYFQNTCLCKHIKTEWDTDSVIDPFGICDEWRGQS